MQFAVILNIVFPERYLLLFYRKYLRPHAQVHAPLGRYNQFDIPFLISKSCVNST